MKEMMKNTGILLVITLIAGLLLGLVYPVSYTHLTLPTIEP